MPLKLHLDRSQLEAFLGKDHEKIKQFEKLVQLVQDYLNTGMVDEASSDAIVALLRANEVAAGLQSLVDSINALPPPPDLGAIEARLAALESQHPPLSYVLPTGEGGTGNTATPAEGDLLIGNGLGFTLNGLTPGANITITTGPGTIEIEGNAGTVTSIDVSGGTTGLTFSGGPVTTSGTITMAGTLDADNGGTGLTSYAVGDLIYASAATTLAKLADVATGNALISGGVTTAPLWGKIGLTTHVSGTLPIANGGTNATTASAALANLNGADLNGATFVGNVEAPNIGIDSDFYFYIDGGVPLFYFGVNTALEYDRTGKIFSLSVDGSAAFSWDANQNLLMSGMSAAASATRSIHIRNGVAPSANPSGGGVLYAESGALKYRGSAGTITTIAAA